MTPKPDWEAFGRAIMANWPDSGPDGFDIKTEEDYLRWMLAQIETQARKDAEPYMKRLLEIESRKPPKPVFIPVDQLPADMLERFNIK